LRSSRSHRTRRTRLASRSGLTTCVSVTARAPPAEPQRWRNGAITVLAADIGGEPSGRCAERERSCGHETDHHRQRACPTGGPPGSGSHLRHAPLCIRLGNASPGADRAHQIGAVVRCHAATTDTAHHDARSFAAKLRVGSFGTPFRPQHAIDFVGQERRFSLRRPQGGGRTGADGAERRRGEPGEDGSDDDGEAPDQQAVRAIAELDFILARRPARAHAARDIATEREAEERGQKQPRSGEQPEPPGRVSPRW
jgi:hypothetical protein